MKSKQLANVLLKIIGLYFCLYSLPNVIAGIIALFPSLFSPLGVKNSYVVDKLNQILFRILSWGISYAVQAAIGICLIIKSQKIAAFWFKNEEE